MNSIAIAPKFLEDKGERVIAKIAHKAYCNCMFGGASALLAARRLDKMQNKAKYENIVIETYHSDSTPDEYTPFQCQECGQVYLGRENADKCCTTDDSNMEIEFDDSDMDDSVEGDGLSPAGYVF